MSNASPLPPRGRDTSQQAARPETAVNQRTVLRVLIVLTFSTGMVDAIGFLGLDRIFAGNMTGNVVIIGMALGGGDLPVLGPTIALGGFMGGAALAGMLLRNAPAEWILTTTLLFTATGAMLGVAGVLLLVAEGNGPALQLTISAGLGISMGIQAATARLLAVADVTTVVVTSTVVGLMADQFAAGKRSRQGRRLAAVVAMMAGAVVGAMVLQVHIGIALLLSSVITLGMAAIGAVAARRSRDRHRRGSSAPTR